MSEFACGVQKMRSMAEFLLPFQKTKEDEVDLAALKTRHLTVHGYPIGFYLSKDHRPDYDLWTLQLHARFQPFLPFWVVCDCARLFLGDRELGLTEFMVLGRKLYVWSVAVDRDDSPIPISLHPQVEACCYNGFEFVRAPTTCLLLSPL